MLLGAKGIDRKVYGPYMLLLEPEQMAVLAMHTCARLAWPAAGWGAAAAAAAAALQRQLAFACALRAAAACAARCPPLPVGQCARSHHATALHACCHAA